MIDFDAMSGEQRLTLLECMLGLLPSPDDWQGRAVFAAFLIAGERGGNAVENALRGLERAKPGFFGECVNFARDIKGVDLVDPGPGSDSDPFGQPSADVLLGEVARSGVSMDDPCISYVEVQIERETWEALAAYLKALAT